MRQSGWLRGGERHAASADLGGMEGSFDHRSNETMKIERLLLDVHAGLRGLPIADARAIR
jgi:hypothetical protein